MSQELITAILVGIASLIGSTTPVGPKSDKRAVITWAFALVRSMIGGPPVITPKVDAVTPVPDDTLPVPPVVTDGAAVSPWRKHVDERTNALLWLRKEAVNDGDPKLASDVLALIPRFCDSKSQQAAKARRKPAAKG